MLLYGSSFDSHVSEMRGVAGGSRACRRAVARDERQN
jgi:hypothetical protein